MSMFDLKASKDLLNKFVLDEQENADYDISMLQNVVPELQDTYERLGISCDDVGAFAGDEKRCQ